MTKQWVGWILAISSCAPFMASADSAKPTAEAQKDAAASYDFKLWDELSHKYVDGKGRVDYAKLKASAEDHKKLERLYAEVAKENIDALGSKNAKEAFYIDAYNTIVWKNVIDNGTVHVNDSLYKFFRRDFLVGGKETDLDGLEKKIIRPTFKDPRVHMALNCASGGCPQLPNEAFTPERLNEQLEREAKKFCNEERNVRYDAAAKKVFLSHIFDWYDKDFDKKQLEWINQRRTPDKQIPLDAKMEFVDYDWHLNDPSLTR